MASKSTRISGMNHLVATVKIQLNYAASACITRLAGNQILKILPDPG